MRLLTSELTVLAANFLRANAYARCCELFTVVIIQTLVFCSRLKHPDVLQVEEPAASILRVETEDLTPPVLSIRFCFAWRQPVAPFLWHPPERCHSIVAAICQYVAQTPIYVSPVLLSMGATIKWKEVQNLIMRCCDTCYLLQSCVVVTARGKVCTDV